MFLGDGTWNYIFSVKAHNIVESFPDVENIQPLEGMKFNFKKTPLILSSPFQYYK